MISICKKKQSQACRGWLYTSQYKDRPAKWNHTLNVEMLQARILRQYLCHKNIKYLGGKKFFCMKMFGYNGDVLIEGLGYYLAAVM